MQSSRNCKQSSNRRINRSFATGGRDGLDFVFVDADHGLTEVLGKTCEQIGVLPVGGGLHDGGRTLGRVARLEDAGADEHAFRTKLHHEGCVGRGGHTAGGEVDDRQTAVVVHVLGEIVRHGQLLGGLVHLVVAQETSSRICLFMVRM